MPINVFATINELLEPNNDKFTKIWSDNTGLYEELKSLLNHYATPQTLFESAPELSDYTKIASPGILKRISIGQDRYVLKSVPFDEKDMQANEIRRAIDIKDLLNSNPLSPISHFGFDVDIVHPMAVIASPENKLYTLLEYFPFQTLDDVFLNNSTEAIRAEHLKNIRALYDFLSGVGVFWKDMAPRNILVDDTNITVRYIILDFEKTIPVGDDFASEELTFWRGAVISEEFASSCPLSEIDRVFGDKFNSKRWDFGSTITMSTAKMRRELSVIVEQNNDTICEGDYNWLDRELLLSREPIAEPDGSTLYPGKICFLIDHTLGPEYDRKLNEIYLVASSKGILRDIVKSFEVELGKAGVSITEFVRSNNASGRLFTSDGVSRLINSLYDLHVGADRNIALFMGHKTEG